MTNTAAFHAEGLATISLPPKHSPWGPVQQADKLADGIWQVHTAGHGGIWLSPERQKAIPAYLQAANFLKSATWWEEDCDQAWPRLIWRTEIGEVQADQALKFLKGYKPFTLQRVLDDLAN